MKFGSVKFFKRLIMAGIGLVVMLPLLLAVLFCVLFMRQRDLTDELQAINRVLAEGTAPQVGGVQPSADYQAPGGLPAYITVPSLGNVEQISPSFEYQTLYPQLYAVRPQTQPTEGKVCYLTFDDGPSPVTTQILKVLAEEDIKATFFVTGKNSMDYESVLLAAHEAGHTIGVHTWSHNYQEVYASVDAFLADFEQMHRRVTELTGTAPSVFRFAGGSINAYNGDIYTEIIAEMTRRGFVFFDWNSAASDAVVGGISRSSAVSNVLNSTGGRDRVVVLMHDRLENGTTAAALPDIIKGLREQGYSFAALGPEVEPVTFFYAE